MAKFHITSIRPPGFLHSSGFAEIIDSLSWALSALGHDVVICENTFALDGTNILFGAELLTDKQEVPKNTIVYNLEQPGHTGIGNVKRLASAGHSIWDYNLQNHTEWTRLGYSSFHAPFGFTPNLVRIPKARHQEIDVFFSGWITPRRQKIIDDLRAAKLNVVAVDSCYGGARDNLISRAKICLNINHDGRNLTNIQRLSFWMANSKCILSEFSSDRAAYLQLEYAVVNCSYDRIVYFVRELMDNDTWRHDLEARAFLYASKQDYVATVAAALENHPKPNPILERYERGCREGDMKDFLPWLRKNAKGNCLEIGVRDGASASAMLLGIDENGGGLTSVDIVAPVPLQWGHPKHDILVSDSKKLKFTNEQFDMALIDGDHSKEGFTADLYNCFDWVRNGGLIAVHDVAPEKSWEDHGGDYPSVEVGRVFANFCRAKGLTNFYLPGTNGMGVLVVKK